MPASMALHGDGMEPNQFGCCEQQPQQQHVQLQHASLFQSNVQHVPQQYSWDCGLACVLMVLRSLGCSCDFSKLRRLSETTSIWTVDLAHLLAHFGASVTFSTITIGINSDYANEWFYMEHLEHDEQRVQRLFRQADQLGITVQQRSIALADLVSAVVTGRQLAILLVDKRKIDPWQAAADMAWNYTTGVTSATCYTGHYILLVGYEPPAVQTIATAPKTAIQATSAGAPAASQLQSCSYDTSANQCGAGSSGACSVGVASSPPTTRQDRQGQAVPCSVVAEVPANAPAAAAADSVAQCPSSATLTRQGYFWVHDPARATGPIRIPVSIIESARKTFGTDEDVLLIDLAEPLGSKRAAARDACNSGTVADAVSALRSSSAAPTVAAGAAAPNALSSSYSRWLCMMPWLGMHQQPEHKEQPSQQQSGVDQPLNNHHHHQQHQSQDDQCALHCDVATDLAVARCSTYAACMYTSGSSCCSNSSSSSREQGMITD